MASEDALFVVCECNSSEHILQFARDPENGDIYTEVQLRQYHSILTRCWVALKYIFGYQCKYGHWDCTIMSGVEQRKLLNFLAQHLEIPLDMNIAEDADGLPPRCSN